MSKKKTKPLDRRIQKTRKILLESLISLMQINLRNCLFQKLPKLKTKFTMATHLKLKSFNKVAAGNYFGSFPPFSKLLCCHLAPFESWHSGFQCRPEEGVFDETHKKLLLAPFTRERTGIAHFPTFGWELIFGTNFCWKLSLSAN